MGRKRSWEVWIHEDTRVHITVSLYPIYSIHPIHPTRLTQWDCFNLDTPSDTDPASSLGKDGKNGVGKGTFRNKGERELKEEAFVVSGLYPYFINGHGYDDHDDHDGR